MFIVEGMGPGVVRSSILLTFVSKMKCDGHLNRSCTQLCVASVISWLYVNALLSSDHYVFQELGKGKVWVNLSVAVK
jgi:hypothetical protein